jgi:hypothetical protein
MRLDTQILLMVRVPERNSECLLRVLTLVLHKAVVAVATVSTVLVGLVVTEMILVMHQQAPLVMGTVPAVVAVVDQH